MCAQRHPAVLAPQRTRARTTHWGESRWLQVNYLQVEDKLSHFYREGTIARQKENVISLVWGPKKEQTHQGKKNPWS